MQGLTIILTYIPLVVTALNSSQTISSAPERAADLTQASVEIFQSVSSVISWSLQQSNRALQPQVGKCPELREQQQKPGVQLLLNLQLCKHEVLLYKVY